MEWEHEWDNQEGWQTIFTQLFLTSGGAFTTLSGGSVRGSEAGSNPSDHWAEANGKPFGSSAQQPQPPEGTPSSNGSTQPLLRRNQYWVSKTDISIEGDIPLQCIHIFNRYDKGDRRIPSRRHRFRLRSR